MPANNQTPKWVLHIGKYNTAVSWVFFIWPSQKKILFMFCISGLAISLRGILALFYQQPLPKKWNITENLEFWRQEVFLEPPCVICTKCHWSCGKLYNGHTSDLYFVYHLLYPCVCVCVCMCVYACACKHSKCNLNTNQKR